MSRVFVRLVTTGWGPAAVLATALVAVVHKGTLLDAKRSKDEELSTVAQVRDLIADRWVEAPDREKLRWGAARGMVETLDPFSELISPDMKEKFDEDTQGEFGGIGVFIDIDRSTGKIFVITPLEDTPAWRAKILPGDRFLEIDGEAYELQSTQEAQRKLRGKPGSKVKLLVQTETQPPRLCELERAVIKANSVKGARLADPEAKIGYVRVTAFQEPTLDEFDRARVALDAQGLKALVLDLRGNPGGLLRTAIELAARFLPKGSVIVNTKGRKDPKETPTLAEMIPVITGPVALLLDGGSASASEVLAGALRDNGRAFLVGTRSFGKGSVQNVLPIDGGRAELKLTTQYYFTPSMRRIHRVEGAKETDEWGLVPDIAVGLDPRIRQELVRREAEDELAALKERARQKDTPPAPRPVRPDDPKDTQLEAALAHLRLVLKGEAPLVRPKADVAPIPSGATAKGKPGR